MNIKPRNDVVLVKRLTPKYEGKMFIPETAQEKPTECVVVAIPTTFGWKDGIRIACDLEVGDVVFVSRYGGMEIEEGKEKLLFIREAEIMGVRRG